MAVNPNANAAPPRDSSPEISNVFSGRVRYAMLDDTTQRKAFKDFGEWSSIGCIFFDKLNQPNPDPQFSTDNFARPLFPNQSIVPLENEIVYLMALPNSDIQSNVNGVSYYYFQPINIWNSVHHNAIPDPINGSSQPESQTQDYEQTEGGSVRRVTDGGTEIDLGDTFQEKLSIRNLLPYEGDNIIQGRWGNTIRLGSTVLNPKIVNPWSRNGGNGDPIIIIKNGQHSENTDPWVPQVEDINTDKSSIYLTSTQAIPIEVSNKNYNSYFQKPISTDKYVGEQVILNSGRLLFNSKKDSILLNSFKTINLNSKESLNIDSPKTIIQSKEIYLGDKYATEPVILGDKFLDDFKILMERLILLTKALQTPIGAGPDMVINSAIPGPSTNLESISRSILNRIQLYKSKISKSK
jgi:hypothetical protein|tara:strand:+ start:99 stop:1325 length:1227 start_codon:yes stop_codon:yes gene_type:complete